MLAVPCYFLHPSHSIVVSLVSRYMVIFRHAAPRPPLIECFLRGVWSHFVFSETGCEMGWIGAMSGSLLGEYSYIVECWSERVLLDELELNSENP
jgi:hypothetical protein